MDMLTDKCCLCSSDTNDLISLKYKEESIFQQLLFLFPEINDIQESIQLQSCKQCVEIVDSFHKLKQKIETKMKGLESTETDLIEMRLNNCIDFIVPNFTITKGVITKPNKDGNVQNTTDLKKKFICSVCNGKFISETSLRKHEKRHSKNLLECTFCGKLLVDTQRLERHTGSHTNIKNFKCSKCDKMFFNKISLDTHLKSHIILTTTCKLCLTKFKNRKSYRKHVRMQICTK